MRRHAVALAVLALAVPFVAPACGRGKQGDAAKWASHMGDVPFTVGYAKGMQRAAAVEQPLLYLFTADW